MKRITNGPYRNSLNGHGNDMEAIKLLSIECIVETELAKNFGKFFAYIELFRTALFYALLLMVCP